MDQRAALISSLVTPSTAVQAGRPVNNDGVDITSWRQGGFAPRMAMVDLDGDQALTLNSPAGGANGAEVWGKLDIGAGAWRLAGYLNNGAAVPIAGDLQGYVQALEDLAGFTRIAIVAALSAGTCAFRLTPLETWQ